MKKVTENRIKEFRKKLKQNNIDSFLVLHESNRAYLSGYTAEDNGVEESSGALVISQNDLILATDSRFELQAAKEAPGFQIHCYKSGLSEIMPEIIDIIKCKKIGFESNRISYSQYCKIKESINTEDLNTEFIPADPLVENMRIVKSKDEIKQIVNALKIAESAFINVIKTLKPGLTEKEVAWSMEKQMRQLGAESLSFPTIVASGPNSALPHAVPGDRKIKIHEPILFDWGAKLNGYCSDTSRTVVIGEPDDTFNKVYEVLFQAQQMATEAIRPGVSSKQIDTIARDHIEKSGYGKKFGHGLGHGVGLQIHEPPRLSPLKDIILEKGMVVTVEPGIYLPDWGGIRLENMVLIQENGAEVLNKLDYDDYIIGL